MPTFKEFIELAKISIEDKTSGKRMMEIKDILIKHDAFKHLTPDKAIAILEDLGPTFVKMGQIASNRGDVIPKEYCIAFESLRTHVEPVPYETIVELIEEAYKQPWHTVFSYINKKPLGSASIAQVHKARLHNGTAVAVKVRRAGIAKTMAEDITLMKHLLSLAEFTTTSHAESLFSLEAMVDELERTTADELDFTVELQNLVHFHKDLQTQKDITCPTPYPELSTDSVLVMEFVTGILINEKAKLLAEGINLTSVGERLAQSYITQVIDNGFFHADPHPGNILIRDEQIVWIDMGMMGTLSSSESVLIGKAFAAVASKDSYDLKEAMLALVEQSGTVDHGRLLEQMDALLASYAASDLADINIGTAFLKVIDILQSQNLTLPASLTMLARGFLVIEGVLSSIAPQITVIDVLAKHMQKQALKPSNMINKAKEMIATTAHSAESAAKIPTQVSHSLEMLNKGELKVTANMKASDEILASAYTVAGRLALALISAGLFIGSSVLCTTEMQPQLLGVPVLGFLGYLGAFILGVYVIWETFASRHKERTKK